MTGRFLPPCDADFDRKARLEDGDRRAANAILARRLLRESMVRSAGRTAEVGVLFSSGAFSIPEANEALDDIAHEDAMPRLAYPGICRFRLRPNTAPCRGLGYCPRDICCNE